jgi:hypothetical protein
MCNRAPDGFHVTLGIVVGQSHHQLNAQLKAAGFDQRAAFFHIFRLINPA